MFNNLMYSNIHHSFKAIERCRESIILILIDKVFVRSILKILRNFIL